MVALRLAVLPVALFALDHIVVVDTGTFDARATGVLVRPPKPDHVLQFVISIPRYQRSNDTDNPNGDNNTAHAPMSMPTPYTTQGTFCACISAPSPLPSLCARRSRSPSHLPHAARRVQGLAPKCRCNRYFNSSHTSLNHPGHLAMLTCGPHLVSHSTPGCQSLN